MAFQLVQNLFDNVNKYFNYKQYSTDTNYDVILHVGEEQDYKKFYAHSATLKVKSKYFESALSSRWINKEDDYYILRIPNISPKVFEIILRFMYTDTILTDKSNPFLLFDVLLAADKLCLEKLIDYTQILITDPTNYTNFLLDNLLEMCNIISLFPHFRILQRHITILVRNYSTRIFNSQYFIELPENIVISCLENDNLNLYEIDIWNNVLDWGIKQISKKLDKHKLENWSTEDFMELEEKLKKCIPLIRFHHINSKDFYNAVVPFQPIIPGRIFNGVLKYHLTNEILTPFYSVRRPNLRESEASLENKTTMLLNFLESDKYLGPPTFRYITTMTDQGPRYLNGVTKLTYVPGYGSEDNYVKIDDLIQKPFLKLAFLSTMIVDFPWLFTKLPNNRQIILAKDWDANSESQGLSGIPNTNYLIVHAPKAESGFGCFHAKLMLLIFDKWMRVVISSGNLIPQDWELCENVVFVQDFPSRDKSKEYNGLPEFAQTINDMLVKMGLKTHIITRLPEYDYSKAKAVLIPSIPGTYKGMENIKKFGHGRICKAVKELCGEREDDLQLEVQSSSIGSLNKQFLNEFYRSARGLDPVSAQSRPRPKKGEVVPLPPITVVYPSRKVIDESKYDNPAKSSIASTICLFEQSYNKDTFPKEILRNCISKRDGLLMHSKFILAKYREDLNEAESDPVLDESQENIGGWYYCGSHNFSESALGKVTTSRETKELQIKINNWELGVLFPIYKKEEDYIPSEDHDKRDWFDDHSVPVPYVRPPPQYESDETPKLRQSNLLSLKYKLSQYTKKRELPNLMGPNEIYVI
ncbi:phospholipase D/nuclease [Rhizophagus irregularis DAOM 181602=DAOM 197198]|nr:phospholipase D/nuclease [Rhizophagus irregularis DAOM 181602=DAOM 197198]